MADAVIPVAASAVPAASAAAASLGATALLTGAGIGPVLVASLIGATISIWGRKREPLELNLRWFGSAFLHGVMATVTGFAGSTMIVTIAPGYSWAAPLAHAPQWAWAVGLSGGAHFLLPLLGRVLAARVEGAGAKKGT